MCHLFFETDVISGNLLDLGLAGVSKNYQNLIKIAAKFTYILVLTASTCSLEYSLASISFLTLFDTRVYSSSICLY